MRSSALRFGAGLIGSRLVPSAQLDETQWGPEGLQVRNLPSGNEKWKFAERPCLLVGNGTTTDGARAAGGSGTRPGEGLRKRGGGDEVSLRGRQTPGGKESKGQGAGRTVPG